MKITFDHLQENTQQTAKVTGGETKAAKSTYSSRPGNVSGIMFSKGQEQQAYGKQAKSAQEIKERAGLVSGEDYKNYMAVMSSTMSGEDFSAMMDEGVKPGKTETGDMVTIMDHIKTVMARSGVVISGFNSSADIPMEKLEAMTGSSAYAQSMANAFAQNDVPLTEENAAEAMKQTDLAMQLTGLSDEAKQYMIENGDELTIDRIYMANHSASARGSSGTGAKSSYFADDLNGYFGKTTEIPDFAMLSEQIEKVIKEAGLDVNSETKAEASWILEKGMLLTGDNLEKLHRMNTIEFPVTREDALSHIAQALREGKAPKEADLSKDGIYKQAAAIKEAVDGISPEAVEKVVSRGEILNIRNLTGAQRSIDAAMSVQISMTDMTAVQSDVSKMQVSVVHAQRTMEEVRLQMTISANIMLLKSDYAIETAQLSDLVEQLRATEQKMSQTQGLSLPDADKNMLFQDTMEKTAAIRHMPLAVVGRVLEISESFTLSHVYEEGLILESTYKRAGESYEALMTAPRADFGDRLKDAFSNIDDILADLDFELTEDNRRSVRILAYNKTEITAENLTAVRAADADLKFLLDQMTPSATLRMIRDGVNPLEQSVSDLTEYFMQQEEDPAAQAESFAKFLHMLDRNHDISPEERDTYMGIYRLIRQIEKGDGKAIGTVVANGQELSFANLLSAVRTSQKRGINATIDDDFGLLNDTEKKGTRISDQINHYYETKATELLSKINPFVMAENGVTMDTTWEELMEMSQEVQIPEQVKNSLEKEQLQLLRNQMTAGGEAVEYLIANGQPVTPDNLSAAEKLTKNRGEMFRKVREMLSDTKNAVSENTQAEDMTPLDDPILGELEKMTEQFTDAATAQEAYEQVQGVVSERLEEKMLSGEMGYLDIRALTALSKQLSLCGNLAKEEHYELPAVIDGQLTGVSVRFRHDEAAAKKGSVSIRAQLAGGEQFTAELKVQGDVISGYMGCDDREKTKQLEAKKEEFIEKILSETGKKADINIVYSEEIKATYYDSFRQAGKPAGADVEDPENRSEEVQGRHTSAKELYQAAKAVIALLENRA